MGRNAVGVMFVAAAMTLLASCNPVSGTAWHGTALAYTLDSPSGGWIEVGVREVTVSVRLGVLAHVDAGGTFPCMVETPDLVGTADQCGPVYVNDSRVVYDPTTTLGYRRLIRVPAKVTFHVDVLIGVESYTGSGLVDVRVVDDSGTPVGTLALGNGTTTGSVAAAIS